MSRVGKLETIVEVKAPAAKIHEVFSCRSHIVTIRSPESVESCELLEGERGKPGRVICWRFCRVLWFEDNMVLHREAVQMPLYWRNTRAFYSIAKSDSEGQGKAWCTGLPNMRGRMKMFIVPADLESKTTSSSNQ